MSLEWTVALPAGSDQYSSSSSMTTPMTNIWVTLFQLSHIYAGGATHFNHLKYSKMVRIGTRVSIFLMAVSDVLPGTLGVSIGSCLARHMPAVPHQNFRPPKLKARYPYLPNARSTTRQRGNDFRGCAIFRDGGTRVVDGETFAGRGVISRSHHERIDVMFGPVATTEAHLAFSGAKTQSNNTAEMTAMIEALSFLGPHGPVARDEQSCIYYDSQHVAGVCLGTIQARTCRIWFLLPRQSSIHDVSSADPLGLRALSFLCLCVLCSNAMALAPLVKRCVTAHQITLLS